MTAPLNDYAGAKDWRWSAIDDAKIELEAALNHVAKLDARLIRTCTRTQLNTIRKRIKTAIARLEGGR